MAIVRVYLTLAPPAPPEAAAFACAALEREFSGIDVCLGPGAGPRVVIEHARWRLDDSPDPLFEVEREDARALEIVLEARRLGADAAADAIAVLGRHQRLLDRRNEASRGVRFDVVLARHAALHDRALPLVRADLHHAHDVWQWSLRLFAGASLAVQLAALFHDVERLRSEATTRVEHHAGDYQAFKDAHARVGATMMVETLGGLVEPATLARAASLVAAHERNDDDGVETQDGERRLLADADALSFFSLNSFGFVRWFDAVHTRRKVAWTLARMSVSARARLASLHLPGAIEASLVDSAEERA